MTTQTTPPAYADASAGPPRRGGRTSLRVLAVVLVMTPNPLRLRTDPSAFN